MNDKLGRDDLDILASMSNLAGYYNKLGHSKRAAEIEQDCWQLKKEKLGRDHLETLTSMSNLAGYYDKPEDSQQAAEMAKECWRMTEDKLGGRSPKHAHLDGRAREIL